MLIAKQHKMDWKNGIMPYRESGFYGHFPRNGCSGYVCYVFPLRSRFSRLMFTYWGKPIRKRLELQRKDRCYYCNKPGNEVFWVRFPIAEKRVSFSAGACRQHRGSRNDPARIAGSIKDYNFKGAFDDGDISQD